MLFVVLLLGLVLGFGAWCVPLLSTMEADRVVRQAQYDREDIKGHAASLTEVDGHQYIVSRGFWEDTWIHAESCLCRKAAE